MNKAQATIILFSAVLLFVLVIYPPWQEAAKNEIAYRKDIGRGFLRKPPDTISVDCYFIGCTAAPASYFHPELNRALLFKQVVPVLVVAAAFLWLFRTTKKKTAGMLQSRSRKMAISFLLAMLVPPTGGVPMGVALAYLPMLLIEKGEFWAVYAIWIPAFYFIFAAAIYLLLSAMHWLIVEFRPVS